MAAQPFHRMAPVPPHLSYKPEISTYMDHFRVPRQPPRRRYVLPPEFLVRARPASAKPAADMNPGPRVPKVKTTVKDYMDSMLKMTGNDFPVYNARVDIPCKSAQPSDKQRRDLNRIARTGFGISDTSARDIVRKDRSVDFYHQEHKVTCNKPLPDRSPLKSAPQAHTNKLVSNSNSRKLVANSDSHWICWNSGTPEPPGLQRRLHRPWPTPEPPKILEESSRCSSRVSQHRNSAVARPASNTLLPANPTQPIPDMIGSDGTHPSLTMAREQAYTPQPANLPNSQLLAPKKSGHPVPYVL